MCGRWESSPHSLTCQYVVVWLELARAAEADLPVGSSEFHYGVSVFRLALVVHHFQPLHEEQHPEYLVVDVGQMGFEPLPSLPRVVLVQSLRRV